jgi:AcrR family transcriptional regulator
MARNLTGRTRGAPTEVRPTRKAQAEASRQRLLDAVFACLLEVGYAGTTITAITKRAGVSNGALFNHFATKEALLVAAATDLGRRLFEQSLDAIEAIGRPADTARIVDVIWDGMRDERTQVLFELYTAARTNPELRTAFTALESEFRAGTLAVTRAVYPERRDADGLELYSLFTLVLMQGAAMHDNALGPQPHITALKPLFVRALDDLLPTPPT